MRQTGILVALVVVAGLAFFAGRAFTDDEPAPGGMDPQEMEKMMRELATPGPQHAQLAKMAGTWDVTGLMWMDPSQEPIPSQGTAKVTSILGGRYLVQDYDGQMMGEAFQGHGLTGFDNFKKEWWNVWVDTWGTSYLLERGPDVAEGKPCEMKGTWESPMGKTESRSVMTIVSDDEHKLEMFGSMMPGQPETKFFELVYKRRK